MQYVRLNTRVDDSTGRRIYEAAAKTGRTVSEFIRQAATLELRRLELAEGRAIEEAETR